MKISSFDVNVNRQLEGGYGSRLFKLTAGASVGVYGDFYVRADDEDGAKKRLLEYLEEEDESGGTEWLAVATLFEPTIDDCVEIRRDITKDEAIRIIENVAATLAPSMGRDQVGRIVSAIREELKYA